MLVKDKILMNSIVKQVNIVNPKIRRDLKYDNGEYIPYLDKNTYYRLQSILKELTLCIFGKW